MKCVFLLHAVSKYSMQLLLLQELDGKLKIVKVEADPNPGLVEKYKASYYH